MWLPRAPGKKGSKFFSEWAREQFLELLRHGYNFSQASEELGLTYQWWEQNKKRHADWAAEATAIKNKEVEQWEYPDLTQMPFAEFVEHYAGFSLAEHQLRIAAALEDPLGKLVLILGHPESGKSTLVSLWYLLYRIAQSPETRIALVSKNSDKAKDLLRRIKRHLTEEHLFDEAPGNLVADFNGWKPHHASDLEWSENKIFVKHRTSGERDATVEALGIGKQIYGSRLDYLVLDDALVMDNQTSALTRERIDNWFDGEARSRAQRGQTVVNGTRLLPGDLYGFWKKAWVNDPLFRHVKIPAILNEWSEQEVPSWPEYWTLDGYDVTQEIAGKEVITGYQPGLRDFRRQIMAKYPDRWKLIYQQEDVEEASAVFRQVHMDAALELGAHRRLGQVHPHERLILGVDPATSGRAASILIAVDPLSMVRTVVDIYIGHNLGAAGVRSELMYRFWEKYRDHRVDTTVLEINFAPTLIADETLMARAAAAGTHIQPFRTLGRGSKRNKWDEEYGIGAMAALFGGGLLAFANAGEGDLARLEGLIDDLMNFPWSDTQDGAIGLWLANSEADSVSVRDLDQDAIRRRRGVPPVVTNR